VYNAVFRVQVRYSDVDEMGIVYFARHLVYADEGITEFLKERGIDFNLLKSLGVDLAVVSAHCDYERPIRYGDEVMVETKVVKVGNTSITFQFEIYANGQLASRGYIVYVTVDKQGFKVQIPGAIREVLLRAL